MLRLHLDAVDAQSLGWDPFPGKLRTGDGIRRGARAATGTVISHADDGKTGGQAG
jgi:hypothetical protein